MVSIFLMQKPQFYRELAGREAAGIFAGVCKKNILQKATAREGKGDEKKNEETAREGFMYAKTKLLLTRVVFSLVLLFLSSFPKNLVYTH